MHGYNLNLDLYVHCNFIIGIFLLYEYIFYHIPHFSHSYGKNLLDINEHGCFMSRGPNSINITQNNICTINKNPMQIYSLVPTVPPTILCHTGLNKKMLTNKPLPHELMKQWKD